MKKICFVVALVCIVTFSHAQHLAHQGFEIQEIIKIAETYRNAPNLSYNVDYYYYDSAHADSALEHLTGYSKISDGRYYTFLDSTEYIQGYQYNVMVSHRDSTIAVDNRQEYMDLTRLPLLDSIFQSQYVDSLKVYETDDVPTNSLLVYLSPQSQYSGYLMVYNRLSYTVQSVAFYIKDVPRNDTTYSTMTGLMRMVFSGYSTNAVTQDVFWEDKFIYKQEGEIRLKPAYASYQLFDNTTIKPTLPQ
jgi:hypothetical protein